MALMIDDSLSFPTRARDARGVLQSLRHRIFLSASRAIIGAVSTKFAAV
jgi:hypothetical protein